MPLTGGIFYNSKAMKIPVIFNMASMPSRIKCLEDTVNSILPQCDKLNIYLNNFQVETPQFLKHNKIKVFRSENEAGDLGDVGKFWCCESWSDAYIFTIDDKYIYAPDYAKKMIECIEKYGRKAVIACHGRLIKPNCISYYMDVKEMFTLGGNVPDDIFSHELGTGCMALHTDTFTFTLDIFTYTNMTDILASMALQKAGIPILIMKHQLGWVRVSPKCDQVYSIHNFYNRNDNIQTKLINSFKWKINKCNVAQLIS
jgi:hypothetical protein